VILNKGAFAIVKHQSNQSSRQQSGPTYQGYNNKAIKPLEPLQLLQQYNHYNQPNQIPLNFDKCKN